jgi:hypothetical protein
MSLCPSASFESKIFGSFDGRLYMFTGRSIESKASHVVAVRTRCSSRAKIPDDSRNLLAIRSSANEEVELRRLVIIPLPINPTPMLIVKSSDRQSFKKMKQTNN